MNPAQNFPNDILLELLSLRQERDLDAFMDKLYQAMIGEFRETLFTPSIMAENREIIPMMIDHFIFKEEYEKCALLKYMQEVK
jgi:hypothetical protein